jgi:UDP-3-O-[3-hydroxymyristoyl] N-acetylglucosamine deacetylase
MSAFAACSVTDAHVELTYPELPGLDGSAILFMNSLIASGSEDLDTREVQDIYSRLFIQAENLKIAVGKGSGHWRFDFVTGERWPGEMTFESQDILADYLKEVAPARTTVFTEEIEHVKAAGLGQGLDESSVLIIGEHDYQNSSRFPDEPARHKLLDLIGDLYLSGVPIDLLNVVGYRSGHRSNVEMAKLLFESCRTP